jgi:hypothetical protein
VVWGGAEEPLTSYAKKFFGLIFWDSDRYNLQSLHTCKVKQANEA